MLKKTMTFEDFNGQTVTRTFRFHLTEADVADWEMSEGTGGLIKLMERVVASQNGAEIVRIFREVILRSYGELSDDGLRFVKSKEISEAFSQTQAYSDLFMELATGGTDSMTNFINGILPKVKQKKEENKN